MAKNTSTRARLPVKWVRDRAKSAYVKQAQCYICGTTTDLELHHVYSITRLLERWSHENNHDISTDAGICLVRDEFIAAHQREIFELVYTLCNPHHVKLHAVYGKKPEFGTELKQKTWIERQAAKALGTLDVSAGGFSKFY